MQSPARRHLMLMHVDIISDDADDSLNDDTSLRIRHEPADNI